MRAANKRPAQTSRPRCLVPPRRDPCGSG